MRMWYEQYALSHTQKSFLSNGLFRQKYKIEKAIMKLGINYKHLLNSYYMLEIVPSAKIQR